MKGEIINIILYILAFGLLFFGAEVLFIKYRKKAELTRKIVHVGTGLLCMGFPYFLKSHWSVLFLCALFFAILILSKKFHLLDSINKVDRKTLGSLYFPIAVYISYFCYDYQSDLTYFFLPILVLSLADPAAEMIGKLMPIGPYKIFGSRKTIAGSSAFFIVAFAISCLVFNVLGVLDPLRSLAVAFPVAFIASTAEGLSHRGIDNLTIPISVIMSLTFLI